MTIFLDYQSTTPVDARVLAPMAPYWNETFGNPHGITSPHGLQAALAVEKARVQVAKAIGAKPQEIIFTSGATESANLALKGGARARRKHDGRTHLITLTTEHSCVLESMKALEKEGFELTVLPVQPNGIVSIEALENAMTDKTALVAVMAVNNEIGVIQPMADIAKIVQAYNSWLYCDATQALGKIPFNVAGYAMAGFSSHKIYGPMGIGALYIRSKPRVIIEPLVSGGGQERGLRSGTLPVPLCVGFGEACALSVALQLEEAKHLKKLQNTFLQGLVGYGLIFTVNGDLERRIPGNIHLTFANKDEKEVLARLTTISISQGSACSVGQKSHVLEALGHHRGDNNVSLRFGFGRFTTMEDIQMAQQALVHALKT